MAGKLLYSRVLQNRMVKSQAVQDAAVTQPIEHKRPQQYYTSQNEDFSMDNRRYDNKYHDDKGDAKGEGNKIRRGPGRRIAKEKRMRSMDPALMNKYSLLPESMQEKVNATIEICYQQYMAGVYKNPGHLEQSHYDDDIEIDAELESIGVAKE